MTTAKYLSTLLVHEMEGIVGVGNVISDPFEIECATVDVWWITRYLAEQPGDWLPKPEAIVFPASTAEVSRLVSFCSRALIPITPRGGGANDSGGCLAVRGGIVVDTKRMDKVLQFNEKSMTVRVQPGILQIHLEEWLNKRGATMNHFPASINCSTIGGFVSTNGTGVLSSKYGKMTDMIQQLEVVLPNGSVFRSLPVNRHSTGPDLTKLFVGAEGTLGLITEILAKVHPLPESRIFRSFLMPDLEAGLEAGRQVMVNGCNPMIMRLYDVYDTEHILKKQFGLVGTGCFFMVGFDGPAKVAEAQLDAAMELLKAAGGEDLGDEYALRWWDNRLKSYYPPLDYICEAWMTAVTDTVASYESIGDLYKAMKSAVEDEFAEYGAVFHAHFSHWYNWGNSFYPSFVVKEVPAEPEAALDLYHRMIDACGRVSIAHGGALNEHHGTGIRFGRMLAAAYGEESFSLLRSVKVAVDPRDLMNPGKLGL